MSAARNDDAETQAGPIEALALTVEFDIDAPVFDPRSARSLLDLLTSSQQQSAKTESKPATR